MTELFMHLILRSGGCFVSICRGISIFMGLLVFLFIISFTIFFSTKYAYEVRNENFGNVNLVTITRFFLSFYLPFPDKTKPNTNRVFEP